jgi:predicted RNA-binding Zn ribbon-like protein
VPGPRDSGAPASALLVRDFVNTVEWQEDAESWTTPGDLARWFTDRAGVRTDRLTEDDLALARRLREGLRSVLLQHAGHEPLPSAAADLNETLERIPLVLRVDEDGRMRLGHGTGAPLAHILAAVDGLRADGGWNRLKACARESCRWAYWDSSRNGSGRWCSMSWCGNHVKMRTRNGDPLRPEELLPVRGERRAATLVDVAARAGVSMKTVSNVLSGAVPVSPRTRARVVAAIDELDYRPNAAARELGSLRARRGAPTVRSPGSAEPLGPVRRERSRSAAQPQLDGQPETERRDGPSEHGRR